VSAAEHDHGFTPALEPEPEEALPQGAPAWTATFGNLMTLLVCFFVLQMSFSKPDPEKFAALTGKAGPRALVDLSEGRPGEPVEAVAELPPAGPTQEEEMMEVVDRVIRERGLAENVEAAIGEGGVTIRVDGQLMFQPDSDALRPQATAVFEEIAELAVLFPYDILVAGHTGDAPQPGGRFATDWELASAQAVAGVRYLIDVGRIAPERIHAASFAHTRPLVETGNEQEQARNHRLEFVFFREERRPVPARERAPAPAHDAAAAHDRTSEGHAEGHAEPHGESQEAAPPAAPEH